MSAPLAFSALPIARSARLFRNLFAASLFACALLTLAGKSSGSSLLSISSNIVDRGYHYRVIETTRTELDESGKSIVKHGHYTELENGMRYYENSEWRESQEVITPHPQGAIAANGAYKVLFASDLDNEQGAIHIQMPDNNEMRVNIHGIAWQDAATGQSYWIAQTTNCTGEFISNNEVLYKIAFNGLAASVRCLYRKGVFEAAVILDECPVLPDSMSPENARLQIVSEFIDAPAPKLNPVVYDRLSPTGATNQIKDTFIDFGAMQIPQGHAFLFPENQTESKAPVSKEWIRLDNRDLLFESIEYGDIRRYLDQLPKSAQAQRSELIVPS